MTYNQSTEMTDDEMASMKKYNGNGFMRYIGAVEDQDGNEVHRNMHFDINGKFQGVIFS